MEGRDVVVRQHRGVGAVNAGLPEGEHPLDEVMDILHAVVILGLDLGEGAAPVVGTLACVESDDR